MVMQVVIGSNWGDEGKGQVTDYLAHKAVSSGSNCLVVLCNGGAQRGHTVTTSSGIRHIFHHFGSGTFAGADTYIDKFFIVNPMTFRKEFEELKRLGFIPKVYVNPMCKLSTPYDMIINQIVEDSRGDKRYGSCGMGIWETEVRYSSHVCYRFGDILKFHVDVVKDFLKVIRDEYVSKRLFDCGVVEIPSEWKHILYSESLIDNYINDLRFMFEHITLSERGILNNYSNIIFEMGQGLMLSEVNSDKVENSTPSNPGLYNPLVILNDIMRYKDLEVYYVTRSYLTRHGAGSFPGECSKNEINSSMIDLTNVPNPFQGTLRYAKLDSEQFEKLITRTLNDFEYINLDEFGKRFTDCTSNIVITHINECDFSFNIDDVAGYSTILVSDGEERESFREW